MRENEPQPLLPSHARKGPFPGQKVYELERYRTVSGSFVTVGGRKRTNAGDLPGQHASPSSEVLRPPPFTRPVSGDRSGDLRVYLLDGARDIPRQEDRPPDHEVLGFLAKGLFDGVHPHLVVSLGIPVGAYPRADLL